MSDNPLKLTPAVQQATQAAAAQFQLAVNAPAQGYRLLYITVPGCSGFHNYDNLRHLDAMGIQLQYVNVFNPGQTFVEKDKVSGKPINAPGHSLRASSIAEAINYLASKGLDVSESTHAVLLRPDGSVMHEFNSTKDPNFMRDVQRLTHPTPTRGATRA